MKKKPPAKQKKKPPPQAVNQAPPQVQYGAKGPVEPQAGPAAKPFPA